MKNIILLILFVLVQLTVSEKLFDIHVSLINPGIISTLFNSIKESSSN